MSPSTNAPLTGQVAVVTGASSGIGAVIAKHLGALGAAVAVNYRKDEHRASAVRDEIISGGGSAIIVRGDVTVEQEMLDLAAEVRFGLGPVGILVCNAYGSPSALAQPLLDPVGVSVATADQLLCTLLPVRACLDDLRATEGNVVLIGSHVSRLPDPYVPAITIAKAAQDATRLVLARQLGEYGVRVNTVAPGAIRTETNADILSEERWTGMAATAPLRRGTVAQDVAEAVGYLSGPAARQVTGAYLAVDGGEVCV
ncbi:SDR family NAD(P)-dependent oxidoreductase [Amycolatopsis sp. NPDC059657]|uniref:SDR family NAD(P)-dependent oxidoreductase n=1 Tax=Amycolatopsis sp. NPDC059657 TaxID=3346899 RepID=UPI00366F99DE